MAARPGRRPPAPHGPGLVGAHPATPASTPPATAVWPDRVSPVAWGPWHPQEFRTATCPEGRVLVVGDCLVSDERLRTDLGAALRAGRPDLVTRWPGSYLAVVVSGPELFAFTDLAGQYPLYFHPGRPFVFGTSARHTAHAAGLDVRLDTGVAVADIFCAALPVLTHGRTPLAGLLKLDAGESLAVAADGSHVVRRHSAPPDEALSPDDWARRLGAALDDAVAARMSGTEVVTADFSGGLDSTSIALLAADHRPGPLPVFTYHHPDVPADDLDHAIRNAESARDLRLRVVRGAADTLPYQDLAAAPATDLPDFAAAVHRRNRLRLRRVAEEGSRAHLGGEGADALLVAPPSYLGDLAGAGRVRRLLAESHAWAKLRQDSPTRVVNRALALSRTSMRRALRAFARQVRQGDARQPAWVDAISWWPGPGLETHWLTDAARRTLVDFVGDHAASAPDTAQPGVADFTAWHDLRRSGAVQRQLGELAREYDVRPRAPFLDNDVIRACTAGPAHRRAAGTAVKPLLRAALRGRVPASAIERRTKGNYLGEEYRGLRLAAPALRAALRESRLADLGLVEPREVVASVDQAAAGASAPLPALNRLIAYDLWLRSV
ncbi:albusnodin/ikarugamycin family macrolactam cyclase [Actinosynnema sp. NPDC023587]|uniref:albusnodin/ikarugamycin family macrolactam cyclase n=1 Tax=Actinosynnema sp. NPDC023587 TaxID=3154695 RepID=UPI0033E9727E